MIRGTLVALAILSPIHGLAQGLPDATWNRLVALALSKDHTLSTECDKTACYTKIVVTGSPVVLWIKRDKKSGHEIHMTCINDKCEHD